MSPSQQGAPVCVLKHLIIGVVELCRDGRVSKMEHAYIRGSKIRFLILPGTLCAFVRVCGLRMRVARARVGEV